MISSSTVCLRTGALPRAAAFGTDALASVLLLGITQHAVGHLAVCCLGGGVAPLPAGS
jgi:hypothetical protein